MNIIGQIKGLVFDMDGTLLDNIKYHKEAWLTFLKKHNVPIDAQTLMAQNHGTIEEMIVLFFGKDLSVEKIKELGEEKESLYRDICKPHVKEIDGLTDFLKQAKSKGLKIGLSTMGTIKNIDFVIDTLHIREYFDAIVGGDDVTKGKPDPEIFIRTAEKLGLSPKDCIAFEDSTSGIKSATSAGFKVVGITTNHVKEDLLNAGCYNTINDYKDGMRIQLL